MFFSPFFFFSFCFCVCFGVVKGQVGWPEGPPHLALNPPYLFFEFLFGFFFFCFGGFKGQVMWPKGPPHLALNPPYLFVVLSFFSFPFFASNRRNLFLPLEKGIFCLFLTVSVCFSSALFGLPLFQFLFLCLSLLLFFLSSFLSPFAFFCFLVFVSLFPFLSSLLLFHEKNNIKMFTYKVFLHQSFLFLGFLSCFLFEIPFLYLCIFPHFRLCFCSTSLFLVSKNQVEKHQFLVKRGVATKRYFL